MSKSRRSTFSSSTLSTGSYDDDTDSTARRYTSIPAGNAEENTRQEPQPADATA